MQRVLLTAGLLCSMNVLAFGQTTSDAPRVALPESPSPIALSVSPSPAMTMPELVMPNEPGPLVEGPSPTPIGVDLTYADRVSSTVVARSEGPAGPTDSTSVAWPAVASADGTVLMAVQSKFRVTDRCGNTLLEQNIADRVPTTGVLTAPSVIYDPWTSRWAMLWLETDIAAQVSNYVLMVTTGPGNFDTASWVYYRINAKTGTGADLAFADAPRLGYGPRGLSFASDQFRFSGFTYTGTQTLTIPNGVFDGAAVTYRTDFFASAENLLGIYPAKMQATVGDLDAVFVATRRAGGSDLWIWRVNNAFAGTRSGTPTTLPVGAYAMPPAIVQPEGRVFNRGVDCRLRSAVVTLDASVLKLFTVHNVARADPTQQAMIMAYRVVVGTPAVEQQVFYVYGGNPEIAIFAPTLAAGYDGTVAIGYTVSSPTADPSPVLLMTNPLLTTALSYLRVGTGARHASAFGYGVGIDFDWNDYLLSDGRRFVALGQYGSFNNDTTPTQFASFVNDPGNLITYTGVSPIVFRKPPGATSFTPSAYSATIGNEYATAMTIEMDSQFDDLSFTPSTFTLAASTGRRVVTIRPGAAADSLPIGVWSSRLSARPCGLIDRFNIPVYFQVGCIADMDDGSGLGRPDGGVTIDDLLFFMDRFSAGGFRADVDDGSGSGIPDGGVTIDDLLYYLDRFDQGC
jgi:hypothetical protein